MQLPRLPISAEAGFIITCSLVGFPLYAWYSQRAQRLRLEEQQRREADARKRQQEERRRRRGGWAQ
jgi:hypothetical protein